MTKYEQALATDNKELKSQVKYNMGNTFFMQQKPEEALAYYKDAVKLDQNNREAAINYEIVRKLLEQQQQEQQQQDQQKKDNKDQENRIKTNRIRVRMTRSRIRKNSSSSLNRMSRSNSRKNSLSRKKKSSR
jgi:Ca-activated chloride channel homolog